MFKSWLRDLPLDIVLLPIRSDGFRKRSHT
jgi:hypothetical protein